MQLLMTTLLFQMEDYLPVPSADLSVATDVSESSSRYGDNHQLAQFKVEFKIRFWLHSAWVLRVTRN